MSVAQERRDMSKVRFQNMELRRQRILDAARKIVVDKGIDALTTRGLADAANISAPTLYNLIGSKDDIIRAMVVRSVEEFKSRVKLDDYDSALDMMEAIIEAATDPDVDGADFAKAIIISGDRVAGTFAAKGDKIIQASKAGELSIEIAARVCRKAIAQGILRGNLCASEIGHQLFICYRGPRRDWAYGLISLQEAKRRIKRGFYITMAADASPEYREILLVKIQALDTDKAVAA